jgi:hypothetical protein
MSRLRLRSQRLIQLHTVIHGQENTKEGPVAPQESDPEDDDL